MDPRRQPPPAQDNRQPRYNNDQHPMDPRQMEQRGFDPRAIGRAPGALEHHGHPQQHHIPSPLDRDRQFDPRDPRGDPRGDPRDPRDPRFNLNQLQAPPAAAHPQHASHPAHLPIQPPLKQLSQPHPQQPQAMSLGQGSSPNPSSNPAALPSHPMTMQQHQQQQQGINPVIGPSRTKMQFPPPPPYARPSVAELVQVPAELAAFAADPKFQQILLRVKEQTLINFISLNRLADDFVESVAIDAPSREAAQLARNLIETHLKLQLKVKAAESRLLRVQTDLFSTQGEIASGQMVEFMIPSDLIGLVIGKKGARIKQIESDTGVTSINVRDNGHIMIYGPDSASVQRAREQLELREEALALASVEQADWLANKANLSTVADLKTAAGLILARVSRTEGAAPALEVVGTSSAVTMARYLLATQLEYVDKQIEIEANEREARDKLFAVRKQYGLMGANGGGNGNNTGNNGNGSGGNPNQGPREGNPNWNNNPRGDRDRDRDSNRENNRNNARHRDRDSDQQQHQQQSQSQPHAHTQPQQQGGLMVSQPLSAARGAPHERKGQQQSHREVIVTAPSSAPSLVMDSKTSSSQAVEDALDALITNGPAGAESAAAGSAGPANRNNNNNRNKNNKQQQQQQAGQQGSNRNNAAASAADASSAPAAAASAAAGATAKSSNKKNKNNKQLQQAGANADGTVSEQQPPDVQPAATPAAKQQGRGKQHANQQKPSGADQAADTGLMMIIPPAPTLSVPDMPPAAASASAPATAGPASKTNKPKADKRAAATKGPAAAPAGSESMLVKINNPFMQAQQQAQAEAEAGQLASAAGTQKEGRGPPKTFKGAAPASATSEASDSPEGEAEGRAGRFRNPKGEGRGRRKDHADLLSRVEILSVETADRDLAQALDGHSKAEGEGGAGSAAAPKGKRNGGPPAKAAAAATAGAVVTAAAPEAGPASPTPPPPGLPSTGDAQA